VVDEALNEALTWAKRGAATPIKIVSSKLDMFFIITLLKNSQIVHY
jgi:hypothetical protein